MPAEKEKGGREGEGRGRKVAGYGKAGEGRAWWG